MAKSWAALVAVLILIVAAALAGCRGEKPETAGGPEQTAAPKRKVLYWKSSMMPGFRSDKPGKDTMGMDLMPVYESGATAGPPGSVTISPETIQQIGVKTVVVRRQSLSHEVRTVGKIDYDEELVRDVAPKIGGWVEKQYVNFPGQLVRKGDPLGEIYSPELVATEEEYLNALKYQGTLKNSPLEDATNGAQSLVSSVETRLRYWDITDAQIRALRDRGRITRTMVLHAPFTGIVVKKNVFEGGYVNPGESMYRLADISRVWVYADIYEYEAPWLSLGQAATITLAYQPGVSYRGRVVYIYPYLKEQTRTLQVRMQFQNSRGFDLKPEMWADATLESSITREGVAVPVQAVIRTGTKNIALVALGGGHFAPHDLKLGAQAGDEFEVLSGLKAGDRVVTSAEFLIDSESDLQAAVSKMVDSGRTADSAAPAAQAEAPAGGAGPAPQMNMPGMNMPGTDAPNGSMPETGEMKLKPGTTQRAPDKPSTQDPTMGGMDMGDHDSQPAPASAPSRR